jgi:hypothetical protein
MIKLPYGWDSAVQAAKEANSNGSLNNMQIAASIILELDSQLRSPTQTKTVADAVEFHNGVWPYNRYDNLNYDSEDEWYGTFGGLLETLVCTREQFEAYVKDQEEEKWTHKIRATGEYCYILEGPNDSGQVFIKTKNGSWDCLYVEQLKPIKPTISKAEYDAIVKFAESSGEQLVTMKAEEYLAGRDII